jgi:hypothetical protein
MSQVYHAVRRIASSYCTVPEMGTLPPNVPRHIIAQWLADGVITKGRGDKIVDFIEDTGRSLNQSDMDEDEDFDADLDAPDDILPDEEGLDDDFDEDISPPPKPEKKAVKKAPKKIPPR